MGGWEERITLASAIRTVHRRMPRSGARPHSRSRSRSSSRSRPHGGASLRRSRYSPNWGPKKKASPTSTPHKQQPDYSLSGTLTKDRLIRNGVLLKYDESSDAHAPTQRWRLHVFKDDNQIGVISLSERTCYRFGRDPAVL